MDDRLQPFMAITILGTSTGATSTGKQLFRAGTSFKQSSQLDFDFSVSNHHFTFGSGAGVPVKNEIKAEVTARYKIR